jgi:tetratricopeptide (TPR) repeat protein
LVQEGAGEDTQMILDAYRFGRVAKALQANQYVALATTLDRAGLPGEAKALLEEGVASGTVQSSQAEAARLLRDANSRITEDRAALPAQIKQARSAAGGRQARLAADALAGYGRHAEAIELYRLALSKGGDDANLINTRLGATLALAGQKAEAQAALKAVTGPRAELAALWLLWLESNRG